MSQLISEPSVHSKFFSGYHLSSTVCAGFGLAWIQSDSAQLQLVDTNGSVKDTIDTDFRFVDMVLSPKGNLLLSDIDNKCIKLISADRTAHTLFKTQVGWIRSQILTPYKICHLCIGDITVTFPDDGRVVICGVSGKIIKELDKKLFRKPLTVAQNKVNSNLYISDRRKILALDKEYFRYEYTGQS